MNEPINDNKNRKKRAWNLPTCESEESSVSENEIKMKNHKNVTLSVVKLMKRWYKHKKTAQRVV